MLAAFKKLFFWNYERNTWQWDMLCVVILIFIFLTPKRWFENSERWGNSRHQNQAASVLVIGPELIENAQDKPQIEQRIRALTGRDKAEVIAIRRVVDQDGRTLRFEVDIR